jgi:PAS domain S-box-containing protein
MTMPPQPLALDQPARGAVTGRFLRLFLPLAACIVAVGLWLAHSQINEEVAKELEDAAHRAEIGATLFSRQLERPLAHLASLATEEPVRAAVGQSQAGRLDAMANAFRSLMLRNKEYDQVRWIDHSGQERVRFNRTEAGVVRIQDSLLQNKSDRYYVKAAMILAPGETYVSAIDLDVEGGKVEVPHKPMLRLATPALDNAGRPDGVLVINLLMRPLLDAAVIHGVRGAGDIAVLNARGYWLRAADPADEWGFMFGRETTLGSRFPQLWQRMARQERGRHRDANGLWAWQRVPSPVAGSADSPWYVLAHQPPATLAAFEGKVRAQAGGILLALLGLLGFLCRNLALRRAQRDEAMIDAGRTHAEAEALRTHVAEAQRHEAVSALLAAIVNSSEDAIFSTTPEGIITSWNPGAENLLGYSGDEAIGQPIAFLYPPAATTSPDAKEGGAVCRSELTLRHKAGHLLEVAATCSPIRGLDGQPAGNSCMLRDIREEKRAAAELVAYRDHLETLVSKRTADLAAAKAAVEEREIFIRAITDNLPGMVSYWDQGLRCRFANWAYREWFGRSPESMLGITMRELLGEEVFEHSRPHLEAALKGSPRLYERTLTKADGATGHAIVHLIPDHRGDEVVGLFVLVTDVTPVKEVELRLRETNAELSAALGRAAAATAAKSAFLANMSHEIRTPMNAILGMAHLLEKASLPPEVSKVAHRIQSAGRSLLTIINDILDLSKIESGHLELECEPFNLHEVLDNLAALMSEAAAHKDIELVISPPLGLDRLQGDALRLGQVLINLTGNAIKFTERGHVAVSAEVVAETAQEVTLRFVVRDTGVGIPLAKQEEIFSPFTQADVSTTRRSGGTGLGLSIARRLVTLMGGEMGVSSQPGQGSEFWFTMRAGRSADSGVPEPGLSAVEVLIADDSPIALEALRTTVINLGWKPDTVSSGEAAVHHVLNRIGRHGADEIILLDWKMPGMDGLAAAQAIREALKGEHWPIILMATAYARDDMSPPPGIEAIDGLLDKPVTASSLFDAVVSARQRRNGGPAARAAPTGEERLAGLRILVVDDSEINREVAQSIFASEGAHVELAGDGRQALELLQSRPTDFDIVLMDVQMPVMDGHEATRAIRGNQALAALPVVAVTAGAFKAQQDAARAAGMDDFVAKPFDVDATVALILRLTGRAQPAASAQPMLPPIPPAIPEGGDGELYPGLDIARALALWKNPEVYRNFLRQFAGDYGGCIAVLRQGDAVASESLAHKLKGAAGSLRLTEVAECATQLDRALRKGQATAALLDALQAAMDTALASIRRYAPERPESGPPEAAGAIAPSR